MAITTLIPGEGWFAIHQYREQVGEESQVVSRIYPVIGFAVIDGAVCPMVAGKNKSGAPAIMNISEWPGYEGLYHASESAHIRADKTVVIVNNALGEQEEQPNG